MRILNIIIGDYRTSRPDVAALFGRYLPRLGIQTDLVAQSLERTPPRTAAWEGGQALLTGRTGRRARDQLLAARHDIRTLWRARADMYDAIQVRDKVFAAVFAVWIARARRLPLFYWLSFPMSEGYALLARERGRSLGTWRWLFLSLKGNLGGMLIYRYVLPHCDHIFVQSDRMLDNLAAKGIPRARMTAVPMGVDLERPRPTREDSFRDARLEGKKVVAYLGSFDRFRRLEFLLEVVHRLAAVIPDVALLMIGDSTEPGDREILQRSATALGIGERVVWTGWVDSVEAWRWLASADVAVSLIPRGVLYDGASPTKLLEYLALGIPAVVNDLPDQKRVIEESGAGICCAMDHESVVAALATILNDAPLARRMRTAGPRYIAAERNYGSISAKVAAVYRRLASTKE